LDNWSYNMDAMPRPWPVGGRVHNGFRKAILSLWPEILPEIQRLQTPIFYTGHSLGGALATLAATLRPPRAVYTFGSPRVGNARFVSLLQNLPVYRIASPRDIVAGMPPTALPFGYRHVGEYHSFAPYRWWTAQAEGYQLEPPSVRRDRRRRRWQQVRSRLLAPPSFLTNHAPLSYTTGLNADAVT